MKKLLLAAFVALALAACSRTGSTSSGAAANTPASAGRTQTFSAQPVDERIIYFPERERVLAAGDNSSNDMRWQPLGLSFPALLGEIRYGLVLTDTPLTDRDEVSKGTLVPEGSRVTVTAAGDWLGPAPVFRRRYRVRADVSGSTQQGWIDSSAVALMLGESGGLAVGVIPRKVIVGGGEAEYSLLAVAEGRSVTIVDTSYFPFPDSFHPSGVLHVSLEDVNSDSQPEIVLEAETIVSLRFLGSTPVRWKAWLRRHEGALVPIFRYNESFGTDAGYSYKATERSFDSSGKGMRDMVRVDTEYTLVSGQDEFRTSTVNFFPWNGSEFTKALLQDLPRKGEVTAEQAPLLAASDAQSEVVANLLKGDQLYVFDRSDTRLSRDNPASWWYKAVTKSGIEGWINGTLITLSWIDPMKLNRAAFLSQGS